MNLEKFNIFKVLIFFLGNPYTEVYLRELSRLLKLSPYTVSNILNILLENNLITRRRAANLIYFKANTKNLFYKHLKIAFNVKEISDSGLIDYITKNFTAISSIVLYGSVAKGEDSSDSDLDLLVIGQKPKRLALDEFEKKLGRDISIISFKWSEWRKNAKTNKAFYLEIISDGNPLYGYLPVVK